MIEKLPVIVALVTLFSSAYAQEFINAAACNDREKQLRAEFNHLDRQWMDCAGNVNKGQIYNCTGMDSNQRRVTSTSIAKKRDAIQRQAEQVYQICREMTAREYDQRRQESLAAAHEKQRFEKQESERRQQISQERFESERRAEAFANASTQQRNEAARRQQAQQDASRSAAVEAARERDRRIGVANLNKEIENQNYAAKVAAVESLVGLITNYVVQDKVDYTVEDENLSKTQQTYSNIHSGIDKLRGSQVDILKPAVVAQQNGAWAKLRERNLETLGELDGLGKSIDSSKVENSSNNRTQFTGTPLASNPWDNTASITATPAERSPVSQKGYGNSDQLVQTSENRNAFKESSALPRQWSTASAQATRNIPNNSFEPVNPWKNEDTSALLAKNPATENAKSDTRKNDTRPQPNLSSTRHSEMDGTNVSRVESGSVTSTHPLRSIETAADVIIGSEIVVSKKTAPLFGEPNVRSNRITQLQKGQKAQILEFDGMWVKVYSASGEGWISRDSVQIK